MVALATGMSGRVWAQPQDELKAVKRLWQSPPPEYCMKTWWFFGYERTTDEGITADAEALRDAGFGGVAYLYRRKSAEAQD